MRPPNPARPILILSGVQGDTRRYRTFHPYQQLRLAGAQCILSHIADPRLPEYFERAGVMILHRVPFDGYVEGLFRRTAHPLVLTDIDDLIFDAEAFKWIDSPDFQDPVRERLYRKEMLRHRATMEISQAITASTNFLAGEAGKMGKRAWVHRNAFSLEMQKLSALAVEGRASPSQKVVIGYASGTPTHNRDFELAAPALQKALRDHPQVELMIVGHLELGPEWQPFRERIRRQPFVPWRELPAQLAQFDINLAPLALDNPFSQSKSEIKYVEAGLVGVPSVASPTSAFQEAIRNGDNGWLAQSQEEWEQALEALIVSTRLRREMGQRAYEDIIEGYHPFVRARQLIALLGEIALAVREEPLELEASLEQLDDAGHLEQFWLAPDLEEHPTLIERGWYMLRHRGLLPLLGSIWVYVRRLAAPIFPFRKQEPL